MCRSGLCVEKKLHPAQPPKKSMWSSLSKFKRHKFFEPAKPVEEFNLTNVLK
jgi:hypothetical protein